MNRKVLSYSFIVGAFLSLQSCVSNYVVATPTMYSPKKTEAEKTSLVSSLTEVKKDSKKEEKIAEDAIVIKASALSTSSANKKSRKNNTIDNILSEASTYIGTPYRFGGMTRSGIDCSAFVLSVYGTAAGIELPRVSSAQAQQGERVEKANLEKGDLLFFQTRGSRISHVGIVQEITPEGEIKFIHASTSKGVTISSLNEKYWGARYRFAKRVLLDAEENL